MTAKLALVAMLLGALALPAAARPMHILSLNLCTDQLVLDLAEPARIAAVTWLARDCGVSASCAKASAVPITYGTAEEVIALQADLVIAGRYADRHAVAVARSLGLPVVEIDMPSSIDAVRDEIHAVAAAIDEPERGAAMVAALDRRLAAIPPVTGKRPVAAVYRANGFTVGAGSLVDEILMRAGLDNFARRMAIDNYDFLPLETLIAGAPDLVILEEGQETRPSLASAMLDHPAIAAAFAPAHRIVVPQRDWICADATLADAVERLAAARGRLEARER